MSERLAPAPGDRWFRKYGAGRIPNARVALTQIVALTRSLGRPPKNDELADALFACGMFRNCMRATALRTIRHHVRQMRSLGVLCDARSMKLAPSVRLEYGLPVFVYLAWPTPPPEAPWQARMDARVDGQRFAEILTMAMPSVVPISPYLTAAISPDVVGPLMAERCDAVIVVKDELLLGRADVAAAARLRVPIAYLRDLTEIPDDPWQALHLQTAFPQRRDRR